MPNKLAGPTACCLKVKTCNPLQQPSLPPASTSRASSQWTAGLCPPLHLYQASPPPRPLPWPRLLHAGAPSVQPITGDVCGSWRSPAANAGDSCSSRLSAWSSGRKMAGTAELMLLEKSLGLSKGNKYSAQGERQVRSRGGAEGKRWTVAGPAQPRQDGWPAEAGGGRMRLLSCPRVRPAAWGGPSVSPSVSPCGPSSRVEEGTLLRLGSA